MKISVVTPSLNQEEFIERTILSVLNQSGAFELEYIVIDGGSTDQSLKIIKQYENRLIWTSRRDNGQADAINRGFQRATGDLLAWINADDTYAPGALGHMAELWQRHSFYWAFGNCRIIDARDQEIRTLITAYKIIQSRHYSYSRLLARDFISQPGVFFTRAVYGEIGPLNTTSHYAMDYDYWLRIGRKYFPFYIDRFLANFRWHSQSKNAVYFRSAAYETYLTAKRHAKRNQNFQIILHYLHYRLLSLLYRFL